MADPLNHIYSLRTQREGAVKIISWETFPNTHCSSFDRKPIIAFLQEILSKSVHILQPIQSVSLFEA